MHKLFLFDFDGVLVDSLAVYEERVKLCLEKIGSPVIKNRDDFLALFDDNFYEGVIRKGIDLAAFLRASASISNDGDCDRMAPFAELLPVLTKLGEKNVLAVVSSNVSRVIKAVLSRHGLNECFRDILGADFSYSKRDKILHAMKLFQKENDRTYYICDTTGDVKEAQQAGIKTIAVTWGWHSAEKLMTANPDYLIESGEGLLAI